MKLYCLLTGVIMFGVNWKAAGLAFMLPLPVGQVLASERAEQAWRMIDKAHW